MDRPPDALGWILLIAAFAWLAAVLIRAFTGRYPWEPSVRVTVSVIKFLDDADPITVHSVRVKSMTMALELARTFHLQLVKEAKADRFAVNIAVDPR